MDAARRGLGFALVFWLSGCDRAPETALAGFSPRPDTPVVLISIDTLRSDRLPAYGHGAVETPAIDRFRADAVLFAQAWSHYPLTLPSHVTLLAGRLPPSTGVRDNAGYRLAPEDPTWLPRLLREAGHATGAAVSSYAIRGSTGMDQGFDRYDDAVDGETGGAWGPERDGRRTLARAVEWLDGLEDGRPFFLFFHLYEPHLPHRPPEPFRTRYGDTYEGEIAAADAVVGELLDELRRLGRYDEALVLLLSDHGEGLEDHGEEGHGIFLYREALQVPLIVKLPGNLRAGAAVTAPAQLVDVAPTVLAALGRPVPEEVRGISLLSLIDGGAPERFVYSETMYPRIHFGWSDLASVIEGRFHYIEAPEPELYDLAADPAERENLLPEERAAYVRLRDLLAGTRTPLELPADEDEETRTKLAALGYLAASRSPAPGPLPDPKLALARSHEQMEEAFGLYAAGDFEAAAAAFRALLEVNPQMTDAWRHLGMSLHEAGRPEEALAAFERAMELSRGSPQVAVQIGLALVDLGRLAAARAHAEVARELEPVLTAELEIAIALAEGELDLALDLAGVASGPDSVSARSRQRIGAALSERGRHGEAVALLSALAGETGAPPALNALAEALLAADRTDEAGQATERVLAADPGNAVALEHRGLIALRRGLPAAARASLEEALAAGGRRANAWNLLGVARFQLGDVQGAIAAWQASVDLDPEQWDALYNLGFTAARAGRRDAALRALRLYVDTAPAERLGREIAEARRLLGQLES
jgi:arylsulfatase A-like enzyme/lipoprotein NlpI